MKKQCRDAATGLIAIAVLLYLSPLILGVGVYLGCMTAKEEFIDG